MRGDHDARRHGVASFPGHGDAATGRRVTIVTYHFVRDLKRSRYPRLKALDTEAFREQLAYIQRHYTVVKVRDLIAAADGAPLPPRACLLTFDDGYADHFDNVFPLLDEFGLEGSFFPPVVAVLGNRVLDVNKIQFALASVDRIDPIGEYLVERMNAERERYNLPPTAVLFEKYSGTHRYDTPEVTFVKRLLQHALPDPLRLQLVDDIFARFVTTDEAAFARELYLTRDQLQCMVRHRMAVGSHGYHHSWLDTLDPPAQREEIVQSLHFLNLLGIPSTDWVMCYPYGGQNESLRELVRAHGCRFGLGMDVGIADLARDNHLLLRRLDTNDLPCDRHAHAGVWTQQAANVAR